MALITAPDMTTAGKQARAQAAASTIVTNVFRQMQAAHQQLWNLVWANPEGLTPAQVIAGLGTSAKALFGLATLNASTLQSAATLAADPSVVISIPAIPAGYTVTPNDDGTVTLSLS